jgi:hypothetical protein
LKLSAAFGRELVTTFQAAALADVVDRGEQAGYVVGFGKARRYRGAEA